MIAIAALLMAAAPAGLHGLTTSKLVGTYQTHQMEMGGGLELKRKGHFRYGLSYGAVDEEAAGDWTFDGKTVRLTSNPMPKAPSFELVRDDVMPKGELYMTLEDPGYQWGHPLDAIAITDPTHGFQISADDTGRVDLTGRPAILKIAPKMPVYGPTGDVFPISSERGHRLLFRFHANDLGKVAFHAQPLAVDGQGLVMERYDTQIRFIRARP